MKRTLLSILLLAAGIGCAQAQGTTLSIQNQENAWFYFVIDPAEMKGLVLSSPALPGTVSRYFSRETEEFPFMSLQPLAGLKVEGLPEGTHLLVGFFVFEDREELPVRVVGLQVDGRMGERFYPIYSDPALLSVARDRGRLIRFARGTKKQPAAPAMKEPVAAQKEPVLAEKTASETADAKAVTVSTEFVAEAKETVFPPLARFTQAFRPGIFTREDGDGFQVLEISESKFWGKPGTGLREVRASQRDGVLVFTVSARAAFAQNVSYFLYAFARRGPGSVSPFAVEVKPLGRTGSGIAVLWEKDAGTPVFYGEATAEGDSVTVRLNLSAVPERFWRTMGANPSFDLTSCWFDSEAGAYEEFYLTSFSAADIPDR